jgi:hypothetical protein
MRKLQSRSRRYQPKRINVEVEKRKSWREHDVLVVSERDPLLSWHDRELIRQLGAKLHRRRTVEPNG